MSNKMTFDVAVIGGGHAGCEAAAASARMGVNTGLFTHKIETIGEMSCNPAIGGLGKGHLVREVDALDGVMGEVADKSGIQFRLLNRSKGPAVQGPRTQSDRKLYRQEVQKTLSLQSGIEIIEGEVTDLIIKNQTIQGIELNTDTKIMSLAVVLTTGTFLNGVVRIGEEKTESGRIGDFSSQNLTCICPV